MADVALRKESVDRNRDAGDCATAQTASLSARRAWIEIVRGCLFCVRLQVALRKESVDRNDALAVSALLELVALRKESVDRNRWGDYSTGAATVALRKESVDRNVGA